jgi:hypothetical protein
MPKNIKGGNKAKSQKNSTGIEKKRDIPIGEKEDNSHIAKIIKVQGDSRYICKIVDANGLHEKEYPTNLSIGTKRRYCKGIILKVDSYVLIAIRDFQKDKADIIFAYKDTELNYLADKKLITLNFSINEDSKSNDNDDVIFSDFNDNNNNTNELDITLI